MKIARIICLLLMSLLAICPLGTVLAQEESSYALALTPSDERYDTTIVAGRDKDFRVELENLGEAAVDKINFSANAPEGWTINFNPERLATLEPFDSQRVYVNITVPSETGAGDYMVTLGASGEQASAEEIDIRVIVKTLAVEEKIELISLYSTLEAIAGGTFEFEVEFKYTSAEGVLGERRDFNLRATVPQGWEVYMTPPYDREKKISSISLTPGFAYGEKTRVVVSPPFLPLPEPGEYKITFEAVSGDLKNSVELKAVITAKYILALVPSEERLNTEATAGRDNFFSIEVGNLGTRLLIISPSLPLNREGGQLTSRQIR